MFKDLTCILAKHPIMTNLAVPQNFVPSTDLMHQSISTRRNSWIHLFSNSSWIPRARNDCKKSYNSLFHIWSPSDETSLQNLELFCWKLLRSTLYTFCSSQPFHILEFFSEMSLPKKTGRNISWQKAPTGKDPWRSPLPSIDLSLPKTNPPNLGVAIAISILSLQVHIPFLKWILSIKIPQKNNWGVFQ